MSFTGSPAIGKRVAEASARNLTPAKLEFGGKGAAILFDDVDAHAAAEALVAAVTLNAGQVCCTATRWIVHEDIADAFVDRAVAAMAALRIGYGGDEASQLGPVVSGRLRRRVLGYVERGIEEGAEAYLPGGHVEVSRFADGYYVKPALLGGAPDNICARVEVFGPVAYVMRFRDEEEAIALVNSSAYVLATASGRPMQTAPRASASVWSPETRGSTRTIYFPTAGAI